MASAERRLRPPQPLQCSGSHSYSLLLFFIIVPGLQGPLASRHTDSAGGSGEVNDGAGADDSDCELRRQLLILMMMSLAILGAPAIDRFCANHVT